MAVAVAGGCFNPGLVPRTGDLVQAGTVTAGGVFTVAGYAPGVFRGADGAAVSSGNSAQRDIQHPLVVFFAYFLENATGSVRYAPVDGLELGGSLAIQQQSLELRVALLDEDKGLPVSLALSAVAGWRPIYALDAGWYAVGLELSRRFGRVAPLLNVHASYGAERHAVTLDESEDPGCGGFGAPGCGEFTAGRYLTTLRDEVRLTVAAGVSFEASKHVWVTAAISPYWTAWAAPPDTLECTNCQGIVVPTGFDEVWGLHVTIGATFGQLAP